MSALLRCCCFLSPAPPDSSNQSNALNLSRPGIRSSSAVVSSCTPEQNAGARCDGAPSEAHDATVETSSSPARPDPSDQSSASDPASSEGVTPTQVRSPCTREQDAGAPIDGECNNAHDVNVKASSSSATPDPSDQSDALDPASPEGVFSTPVLSPCTRECKNGCDVIVEASSGRTWLLKSNVKNTSSDEVRTAVEVKEADGGAYDILYDNNKRTRRVTVKIIRKKRGKMRENPMNEMAALDMLSGPDHSHVLQKVAALKDESDGTIYLLMPLISEEYQGWDTTSLEGIETTRKLFRQLVEGMKYMHPKGICHARMCLNNVWFDKSGEHAYITNFGWSLLMPVDDKHQSSRLKSVPDYRISETFYCSPETFKQEAYDGVKVDVFSAGVILFMMLFGMRTVRNASSFRKEFKRFVTEGRFPEAIGLHQRELQPNGKKMCEMLAQAVELLKRMMDPEPKNRPTPAKVLEDLDAFGA